MKTKTRIGVLLIIPVILTGGYVLYPSSLPACDSGAQVNLNLTKMFVDQVESAGAQVIGLNIQNTLDRHDKTTDVRFCSSTVNLRVKQNDSEQRLHYQTDFHIKWGDKADRAYYIELLKLTSLTSSDDQLQQDLNEPTTGLRHDDAPPPLTIPATSLYPTPSLQYVSETTEEVVNHDIIFFATTEDNEAFVTLFKEDHYTIFILGGKEGINYRYVIPKLESTTATGGSVYFEDDGVGYKLMFDDAKRMVLHIHDNSGNHEVVLNTTNKQYINRIPSLSPP